MSPNPNIPKAPEKTYEQVMLEYAHKFYKKSTNKPAKINGFVMGAHVAKQAYEKRIAELSKINDQIVEHNEVLEAELTELKSQNK
jgi:hypothetical protein